MWYYTGAIANGQVTNDAQPTLNGVPSGGRHGEHLQQRALLGFSRQQRQRKLELYPDRQRI